MRKRWQIIPGGLSDADHARIDELAAQGWKPGRIARAIQKCTGTVYWYMLRNGLVEIDPARSRKLQRPYRRGKYMVYPYDRDEDAYIEALRAQDYNLKKIAELATKRFGKPRNLHSIFVRLTILAATA